MTCLCNHRAVIDAEPHVGGVQRCVSLSRLPVSGAIPPMHAHGSRGVSEYDWRCHPTHPCTGVQRRQGEEDEEEGEEEEEGEGEEEDEEEEAEEEEE